MSQKWPISVDVYVTPLLPTTTGSDDPLKQWWSPTSLTLIHTTKSAIIVDTSATVPQTEELADWIEQTAPGKQIKYFFTTHAHPDHFMGFPVLQKRFPGIKAVATSKVLEGIWPMYTPNWAKLWQGFFPNQVDATKHEWEALSDSNELDLDGHILKAYDVIQGDSSANSFLHVPSLDLVVAGDLVYGDCYQYLAEANTKEKRANWIKAVEQIESFKPKIVVPGHKRRSQVDGAYLTESTKEYIRVFERELEKASSAEELEKMMIELYPERWNRFILERSCQSSFAVKTSKEQL